MTWCGLQNISVTCFSVTALTVLKLPDAWQGTTYGLVILVAVIFDDVMSRRFQRA